MTGDGRRRANRHLISPRAGPQDRRMKPPRFSYHDPKSVAEVTGLLASLENARLLAGGQSLMPMLNFRYVLPDHLIDINNVAEWDGIRVLPDRIEIGAVTRQR